MSELYKRIKIRREELGLSQDELAKKIGYKSRSTIAKIESGENDIPQAKIKAFADALDTTPSELMGWDDAELWFDRYFINDQRTKKHIHNSTYECLSDNIDSLTDDIKSILQMIVLDFKNADINEITYSIILSFTDKMFEGMLSEIFNELKINLYGTISNNFTTIDNYRPYYFDSDIVKNKIEEYSLKIDNSLIRIINNIIKNDFTSILKKFYVNYMKIVLIEEQKIKDIIEDTFKDENKVNSIVSNLSYHIKQELYKDIRLEIISDIYYSLNESGQQKISEYATDLGENEKYRNEIQS